MNQHPLTLELNAAHSRQAAGRAAAYRHHLDAAYGSVAKTSGVSVRVLFAGATTLIAIIASVALL